MGWISAWWDEVGDTILSRINTVGGEGVGGREEEEGGLGSSDSEIHGWVFVQGRAGQGRAGQGGGVEAN